MNYVRKQFFLDLGARLKLIVDNQDNSIIKHFDLWNNQLNPDWTEQFKYPAVFLQYQPIAWKQLGKKRQEAFVDVSLHIASHTLAKSSNKSSFQDKALAHLDLLDAVHFWLSGWGGNRTYHGSMHHISSVQDTFYTDVRKDIETYRVQIVDDCATKTLQLLNEVKLILNIEYDLWEDE